MNDDNTQGTPGTTGPRRRRTVVAAAAVGVAGLVAGGLGAGALSSASAQSGDNGGRGGYGAPLGYGARPPAGEGGDRGKGPCGDQKAVTGAARTKVLAAVKAKYPDATVDRVTTDPAGAYEAHATNDGKHVVVLLDKSFKITGTRTAPPGRPGGKGGPGPRPEGGAPGGEQGRPPAPPSGAPSEKPSA